MTKEEAVQVMLGYYSSKDALNEVRADVFRILNHAPGDVPFLLKTLHEGRFTGQYYRFERRDGSFCGCLWGTLAISRKIFEVKNEEAWEEFAADRNVACSAEVFAMNITIGNTTETSGYAALLGYWCEEFMAEQAKETANAEG